MAASPWETLLVRKKPGGPFVPCVANVATIFAHDPEWRNVLAFDEFVGDIVSLKEPPWPKDLAPDRSALGSWADTHMSLAGSWMTRKYEFACPASMIREGIYVAAMRTSLHPVRDWLNSLVWDRKARADTFLVRLAGAGDTPYVRAVSKNFLIGAVARVLCPGEKVDSMPIFEGDQGIGKSSLIRELASEPWYLEANIDMGTKDSYQVLRRKWIVELGELDALTRAEVSRVKQFLSARVDTYRPSFGRLSCDFPRQCVFAGSVNPSGSGYLKDETGARRFWPVFLRKIDIAGVRAERAQLFAEAVYRYRKCEKWHLEDPALIEAAKLEAEDRRQRDPWEQAVSEWLSSRRGLSLTRGVTTHDLMDALDISIEKRTRSEEMRCAAVLRACGWTDVFRDESVAERPRYYRRPDVPHLTPASSNNNGATVKAKKWSPEDVSRTVSRPPMVGGKKGSKQAQPEPKGAQPKDE